MKNLFLTFALLLCPIIAYNQENNVIKLPEPQLDKGKPLMQVLEERQSIRTYSDKEIPLQEMGNLLWAADGINRKESGKRTAPSAMNRQEIDVYVSTKDGLYRYDPQNHALVTILNKDIRSLTGSQAYVATAPVNLIYVSNLDKMGSDRQSNIETTNIDAGFIAQNVYLYCASENMATVVRGSIDKTKLATEMGLTQNQYIIVAQTVGYPIE